MTNKQIMHLKETLPARIDYDLWTNEEKQLDKELSCREMINSCLVYGTDFLNSSYSKDYIKELGDSRVRELCDEQLEHFNNCILIYDVYKDEEGVTYNSILEPEDDGYIHCEIVEEPVFNSVFGTNETYFSVKVQDKYKNSFDVALSPNINNDYNEYYIGRNIGIKTKKTNIGIYKVIDINFFEKNNEIEK